MIKLPQGNCFHEYWNEQILITEAELIDLTGVNHWHSMSLWWFFLCEMLRSSEASWGMGLVTLKKYFLDSTVM